ncbi:unnamed protein product [Owenia fusiformis]|uniref:Uncharacterized protein n=1 Tax=Owenia fusiformis TaxID=6347 RepID=A0A8J1Y9C6_OWEFU|nr:unnamed protein product [Owenia fusiformis]
MDLKLSGVAFLCLVFGSFVQGAVYVSNGTSILKVEPLSNRTHTVITQAGRIVGLGLDISRGLLFWSNIHPQHHGIYRATIDGKNIENILPDIEECNGLTIDWLSHTIYFTDSSTYSIGRVGYDGQHRQIVISTGLQRPRGIVVDPINGYLFWGDQGTGTLERSRLDGSERSLLKNTDLTWPNQLAIDIRQRKLYLVDGFHKTVMSLTYDGKTFVQQLPRMQHSQPLFGLAVDDTSLYMTTWTPGTLIILPLYREGSLPDATIPLHCRNAFSLAVDSPATQPTSGNPCHQESQGGCSKGCLVTGADSYRCVCPDIEQQLAADGLNCKDVESVLLYAEMDQGGIWFVTLHGKRKVKKRLVASSNNPVALAYDPLHQMVYWSDVRDRAIYKVHVFAGNKQVVLSSSQGIGVVDGLTVDYISRKLYFTNRGRSAPAADGAIYNWQRVEMVDLERGGRYVIADNVVKPRAIAVDMQRKYLYYSELGQSPRIIQTWLDGSHAKVVKNTKLSNPNTLTVAHGRLYCVDSNYDQKIEAPLISVFDADLDRWQHISMNEHLQVPFGLSVHGNIIYISDWSTLESHTGHVLAYDTSSQTSQMLMEDLRNPSGVIYTDISIENTVQDPCETSTCTDLCVSLPVTTSQQHYRCLCSDTSFAVYDNTTNTCQEPENFALFADLNMVKLIPLDPHNSKQHVNIIAHANYTSNIVALTFDPDTYKIYWSDLRRKEIWVSDIRTGKKNIFRRTQVAVDGLALDSTNKRLYWVGYSRRQGHIARMGLDGNRATYMEVIGNLDTPRALTLDNQHSYIFWSEYGKKSGIPKISRSNLDGDSVKVIMTKGLRWPNAVAQYGEKLYVADGAFRRIHVMDLDGGNCRELLHVTGLMDHIFGMTVYHDFLVYTDWYKNETSMLNLKTGFVQPLARHLYRPTQVVLHHPAPLTDVACRNTRCTDRCMAVPGGYQCYCLPGRVMTEDLETCEAGESELEPTGFFRCNPQCVDPLVCARIVGTTRYSCVCPPGLQLNQGECKGCEVGSYKAHVGNNSCTPCPSEAHTDGIGGSTKCICRRPGETWSSENGVCIKSDTTTGVAHVATATIRPVIRPTEPPIVPSTTPALPRFVNCPDSLVELILPANQSHVNFNVSLTALDHQGNNIDIEGSHNAPPNLRFEWRGKEGDTQEYVHYKAEDEFGREAECKFAVKVQDQQAPIFTSCPGDIEVETSMDVAIVTWKDPNFWDNVQARLVRPRQDSGSEFAVGEWQIQYQAVDGEGNIANCKFHLRVKQTNLVCMLPVDPPNNGALVCGENHMGYMCWTVCDNRTHVLYYEDDYHVFQCGTNKEWLTAFPMDYSTKACLRKMPIVDAHQELRLTFNGPCRDNDAEFTQHISKQIVKNLHSNGLCNPDNSHGFHFSCNVEDVQVQCGPVLLRRKRKKRNFISRLMELSMRMHIALNARKNVSNISVIQEYVNNHSADQIKEALENNMSISFFDQSSSTPGSIWLGILEWECGEGDMKMNNSCVACPVGTWYDNTSKICVDCPANHYQDEERQMKCKTCPDGTWSQHGSYNLTMCSVPWIRATPGIVMIVCMVGGILIMIGVAVLIYCMCRRAKNKIKKSKNDTQIDMPNLETRLPASLPNNAPSFKHDNGGVYTRVEPSAPPLPAYGAVIFEDCHAHTHIPYSNGIHIESSPPGEELENTAPSEDDYHDFRDRPSSMSPTSGVDSSSSCSENTNYNDLNAGKPSVSSLSDDNSQEVQPEPSIQRQTGEHRNILIDDRNLDQMDHRNKINKWAEIGV